MGVRWSLTVALICVSLVTRDIEHPFFTVYLCLLSRVIYSHPLPIFNWIIRGVYRAVGGSSMLSDA